MRTSSKDRDPGLRGHGALSVSAITGDHPDIPVDVVSGIPDLIDGIAEGSDPPAAAFARGHPEGIAVEGRLTDAPTASPVLYARACLRIPMVERGSLSEGGVSCGRPDPTILGIPVQPFSTTREGSVRPGRLRAGEVLSGFFGDVPEHDPGAYRPGTLSSIGRDGDPIASDPGLPLAYRRLIAHHDRSVGDVGAGRGIGRAVPDDVVPSSPDWIVYDAKPGLRCFVCILRNPSLRPGGLSRPGGSR